MEMLKPQRIIAVQVRDEIEHVLSGYEKMVSVIFTEEFRNIFSKIKDNSLKEKIIKQIEKIKTNPEVGKPMMYNRKGTRELYIPPFRISYVYFKEKKMIYLLDLYHKKKQ